MSQKTFASPKGSNPSDPVLLNFVEGWSAGANDSKTKNNYANSESDLECETAFAVTCISVVFVHLGIVWWSFDKRYFISAPS